MASVLVCGSTAIDFIGTYQGSFADYQENYAVAALNISLQLSDMSTSFGGCAMNITYGLQKLGVAAIPLSVVGLDFHHHYEGHLRNLGINLNNVTLDDAFEHCAMGVITSDKHGNQITLFYPGASASDKRKLPSDVHEIDQCMLAVLAPEAAAIMLRQARNLNKLGLPVILDPGQCIADFSQGEITELLALCQYIILNKHELEILLTNGNITRKRVESSMRQVIVTLGADGVDIFEQGKHYHVDAVPMDGVLDPTGSGDAFRAGYVYGMTRQLDPIHCGRLGNLMAAQNLKSPNTQNYEIDELCLKSQYELLYPGSF